jgi:hypothetical protein
MSSPVTIQSSHSPGNSLAEYAVPTVLILVALVIAIIQLPSILQGSLKDSVKGALNSNSVQVKQFGTNPFVERLRIQLADGSFITLDDYPSSLTQSLETVGTDGTTSNLAQVLKQLAEQIRDKGDAETANQLAELADSMLELAGFQKLTSNFLMQYDGQRPPEEAMRAVMESAGQWGSGCQLNMSGCITREAILTHAQTDSQRAIADQLFRPEAYSGNGGVQGSGIQFAKVGLQYMKASERPIIRDNPALKAFVNKLVISTTEIHSRYSAGFSELYNYRTLTSGHVENRVREVTQGAEANTVTRNNGETTCASGGTRVINDSCPP